MRAVFYLLPALVYLPAGIYFYHFFKRFLSLFPMEQEKRSTKVLSVGFAALCAVLGWRVYGLGAVVVLYFLAACLLVELAGWVIRRSFKKTGVPKAWDFLYRSGLISLAVTAGTLCYGYVNVGQIQRTSYELETEKNLGRSLKIVQLSDLHMGTTMDADKLARYCRKIQGEHPDLLALTGDIFDESTTRQEMEAAAGLLGGIETTYGVYCVFGNHDYNHYTPEPFYSAEELRQVLKGKEIHVLEDETVRIGLGQGEALTVIGRKDASTERAEIGQLLTGANDSFVLLLDHQPVNVEENAGAGIDLQLSGHTHAGQIWPTGQLGELTGIVEFNYGLKNIGEYQLIVNSGIGGWGYPIRTGGHSEYVVIKVS